MSPVATRQRTTRQQAPLAPNEVSGLQLWLKADALALSDNDPVASWTDSSANTLHAVQATAAKKPTYKTNIVNGKPVVRFDGGDTLTCPVYAVALEVSWATLVVCRATLTGLGSNMYVVASEGVADRGLIYARASDDTYCVYNGSTSISGGTTDGWAVIAGVFNGASSTIRLNKNATVTGNAGITNYPRTQLGSNRDLNSWLTGDIAEVVVYDPPPTATELAGLVTGLGVKYGVSVS